MASLRVKAGDWEVLSVPATSWLGNKIAVTSGSFKGPRRRQPRRHDDPATRPEPGQAVFSDQGKGEPATDLTGRSFPNSTSLARLTPAASRQRCGCTRIARIDITTQLVNQEKYVRYQALFPTTIKGARAPTRFRSGRSNVPARSNSPLRTGWITATVSSGLAVLNMGLPGNLVTDGTMMVSLLPHSSLGAYGFGGGYEPGMSSESGFQLGKERLVTPWFLTRATRAAGVFRDGLEFNHPLLHRNVSSRTQAHCRSGGACWRSQVRTSLSRP